MKRLLLILLGFALIQASLFSQEEGNDDYSKILVDGNIYFSSGIPINQLKGNMDPGFGFGFGALVGKKGFPIKGGMDVGLHWHNRVSTDTYIYNGYFDELHELSTTSYGILGDIIIRVEPELDFPVIPYVDVFIGFNRFVTWTSLKGDDAYDDDPSLDNFDEVIREKGDWTRAYGAAAGCKIKVYEDKTEEGGPSIYVNLKAAYRKGGAADYLVKKDDFEIIDSTIEAYEEKRSATDLMIIQAGITFSF